MVDRSGPTTRSVAEALQGSGLSSERIESSIEPLLNTLFWQIVRESPAYPELLRELKVDVGAFAPYEEIVVPHGVHASSNFDLLVLGAKRDESVSVREIPNDSDAFKKGWRAWSARRHFELRELDAYGLASIPTMQTLHRIVRAIGEDFADQVSNLREFKIVAARIPPLEMTALPPKAWQVTAGTGSNSTAGGARAR